MFAFPRQDAVAGVVVFLVAVPLCLGIAIASGAPPVSGLVAGIAAIILTARSNAGQPNAGVGLELESITAAALGGTAMAGGKGSVLGTMLGVLIIGVLANGMILLGVSQFYQFIARGALLIIAVLIQNWQMRPRRKAIPPPAVPVAEPGS